MADERATADPEPIVAALLAAASLAPSADEVAGPAFSEARLLRLGDAYQQQTDWYLRPPPL